MCGTCACEVVRVGMLGATTACARVLARGACANHRGKVQVMASCACIAMAGDVCGVRGCITAWLTECVAGVQVVRLALGLCMHGSSDRSDHGATKRTCA